MIDLRSQYFNSFLTNQQRYNAVKSLALLDKANKKAQLKMTQNSQVNSIGINNYSKFDQTIEMLNKNSKLIIENEFVIKNQDKEWYDMHFSRTTYYKKKKKSYRGVFIFLP
ncbi:hypothetical protein HLA87_02260 [Mycoplasma miroungigenitalium]|uniref:Uncharacterized protein n=1 Tax=Mycoplasma miroungigenitalium TaxID=754515 RepID=A0A6M4JFY3_9MOLU|nr:hypothetical protein [Mycoplasma miroungigenitalium]QJR43601.1 hypothetical protein HLA87_02260 [Mycoplasma miroungigenitalium]